MVDLFSMFRRRPAKRGRPGFARGDITALGDSVGGLVPSPVRDAPPIARDQPMHAPDQFQGDYQADLLTGDEDASLWARVAEMDRDAGCAVRLSVPLSKAIAVYERVSNGSVVTADLGTGTIRVAFDGVDEDAVAKIKGLRADATAHGGALLIEFQLAVGLAPLGTQALVRPFTTFAAIFGSQEWLMNSAPLPFTLPSMVQYGSSVNR